MATKSVKQGKPDSVSDQLEGGTRELYLPPAPRISLYSEEYPSLADLLVGDAVDLEITARVTDLDETGRVGLELMTIKVADKDGIIKKAQSEQINIGELSSETLDKLFGGR